MQYRLISRKSILFYFTDEMYKSYFATKYSNKGSILELKKKLTENLFYWRDFKIVPVEGLNETFGPLFFEMLFENFSPS